MFSGALSDWLGKRKILAAIGYGLAAITKPLFPLAQSVEVLFAARFIDRIGKGIRGAPRDALIADITPPEIRGAAYGLRQSLDAAGAFIGPLLAIALMVLLSDNITLVLWFALIPAVLCMAFLLFGVEEPEAIPMNSDAVAKFITWTEKNGPQRYPFIGRTSVFLPHHGNCAAVPSHPKWGAAGFDGTPTPAEVIPSGGRGDGSTDCQ